MSPGDGGLPETLAHIRAHVDIGEYAPIVLILMELIELGVAIAGC